MLSKCLFLLTEKVPVKPSAAETTTSAPGTTTPVPGTTTVAPTVPPTVVTTTVVAGMVLPELSFFQNFYQIQNVLSGDSTLC